jgi:hypothetical protein
VWHRDASIPLTFREPEQACISVLPVGLVHVPDPTRDGFEPHAPLLVKLPSVVVRTLRTNPYAKTEAFLPILGRDSNVSLPLDESLKQTKAELPRGRCLFDKACIEGFDEVRADTSCGKVDLDLPRASRR